MSGFSLTDYLTEDYGARRVQRKLQEGLEETYRAQSRSTSAIRSQLAQMQGTLEERINQLAKAFDAFVELSDVRADLAMFQEESSVRNTALRMLRGLLRSPAEPPAVVSDLAECRDYWLRPAVATVLATRSEDTATAAQELAEAQKLDDVRTAVFLTAAFGIAGFPAQAMPMLPTALGSVGEHVTYAQRALWAAGSYGLFGEAGVEVARGWAAGFAATLGEDQLSAEQERWLSSATELYGSGTKAWDLAPGLPPDLSRMTQLFEPLVAARQLAGLRSWVTEAMSGEPADSRVAAEPSSAQADGAQADGAQADGAHADPRADLAAVAAALANEGSSEEIALRKRERELRDVIDARKTASRPSWDANAETMAKLLRGDAFGTDLPRRRLALSCCAALAKGVAQRLAAAASVAPPRQIDCPIYPYTVQLSDNGQVSLDAANAQIAESYGPQGMSDKLFHRKELEAKLADEQRNVATEAAKAGAAFAAHVAIMRAAAQQAEADADAIARLLPTG